LPSGWIDEHVRSPIDENPSELGKAKIVTRRNADNVLTDRKNED
jgi:hypothetical protein